MILTSVLVIFFSSSSSWEISFPLRPMTMPGREVLMVITTRFGVRSIRILEMPAFFRRFRTYLRMVWSSVNLPAKDFSSYQFESHERVIPSRSPIGLTLCPKALLLLLFLRFGVVGFDRRLRFRFCSFGLCRRLCLRCSRFLCGGFRLP